MKLFHLVKKDFLLVKKYVFLMLLVAVLIPPFLLCRVPAYAGPMGFVLSVIFSIFMLLQYVSLKESQYPKAATLLCSAPYSRSLLVVSKYLFCLLIYAAASGIFWLETLLLPGLGGFSLEMFLGMFLVLALFLSGYLPVQYRWGYEKTKFFFVVIIMASPFLLPQLLHFEQRFPLDFLHAAPAPLLYGGSLLLSLVLLVGSACLSVSFYQKADLA